MGKVRVPLHGKAQGFATLDTEATKGATVGVNLFWPNGAVVTEAAFNPAPADNGSSVSRTLWSLVLEIPANVQAVAALASDGFVRRAGATWTASQIVNADLAAANTDGLAEGPTNLYYTDERAAAAVADTYFAISQRFAELPDESAVVEARTNLGLQNIDGGTFT